MFTGIIEELGSVQQISKNERLFQLMINGKKVLQDIARGDSVAVNGVCLTVTNFNQANFIVDVMPETVKATALSQLQVGDAVNLERALAVNGRLGGHFVTGHVDEVGVILHKRLVKNAVYFTITVSAEAAQQCLQRGSIAIDGISLTIFDLQSEKVTVSIIPHTLQETTLGFKREGDAVHIETDLLGKYVTNALQKKTTTVTESFLKQHGF